LELPVGGAHLNPEPPLPRAREVDVRNVPSPSRGPARDALHGQGGVCGQVEEERDGQLPFLVHVHGNARLPRQYRERRDARPHGDNTGAIAQELSLLPGGCQGQ